MIKNHTRKASYGYSKHPEDGNQEGEGYNYHYQAHGYHPLLCYDGLTGDLLKAELRDGIHYCSKEANEFIEPLLQEFLDRRIKTYLWGDSGFAAPELYEKCEHNGCAYAIRLNCGKVHVL